MSHSHRPTLLVVLLNLLLVLGIYCLCRVAFVFENWATYSEHLSTWPWISMLEGMLRFDLSAIFYTNALYALMVLLPWHKKETPTWRKAEKWVFLLCNGLSVALNLVDAVYVQYTGRRSTLTVLQEFRNEGNLLQIFSAEFLPHWYLFLLFAGLIYLLHKAYVRPSTLSRSPLLRYYLFQTFSLLIFCLLSWVAMRGGYINNTRPIRLINANDYVHRPAEATLIVNTPFSIIRTAGRSAFVAPHYYTPQVLAQHYTPLHHLPDSLPQRRKNVVVIIVESMSREFLASFNHSLDQSHYQGYAPFLDSLAQHSLTFEQSYANGRKSIDGMPSVLSSLPMFVEPLFTTPAALNRMSGLAGELGKEGYYSAFFHGAERGSMGFMSFARSTGFQHYYGREDYEQEYGKDADFDGTWGVWDEPFLRNFALKMSAMPQPFVTAVFTLSSHQPFRVPPHLQTVFPEEGGHPLYKCIRYADRALQHFFALARQQSWFNNTLFVITADHTNAPAHPEYRTVPGLFSVPILFYDPAGDLRPERRVGLAKQTDILPTVLHHLGYRRPFIAFGHDLLATSAADNWTSGYEAGQYFIIQRKLLLLFDGERSTAFYDLSTDPLCRKNLLHQRTEQQNMEELLKAQIQSYMERMITNQLTPP